jgi:hypothetical protein
MLTHERLVELYRDLKDESILSVYLDVDEHDPAERDAWRRRLERELGDTRRAVESNGANVGDFDAAWSRLKAELDPFEGFIGGRGWVGFASPGSVHYAESLPVPMPDLVRWEHGIRVAPYMRSLKQHRPVVMVLADRQRARVLVYRNGVVEEPDNLLADTGLGDLTDVGTHKRAYQHRVQGPEGGGHGTTSGVSGETATDQAQRIMEVSSDRMWKVLGQTAAAYAGPDGFIVLGGPSETASRLAGYLPEKLRGRVAERTSLHLDMTLPEVRAAAEAAAHELSATAHQVMVDEVVDRARSGGRAVLGREGTERALREMRVETLLLSAAFVRGSPDFADHCAGAALLQQAEVEEVGGAGGARLDDEAGGIGARLRYRVDDVESGA